MQFMVFSIKYIFRAPSTSFCALFAVFILAYLNKTKKMTSRPPFSLTRNELFSRLSKCAPATALIELASSFTFVIHFYSLSILGCSTLQTIFTEHGLLQDFDTFDALKIIYTSEKNIPAI